MSSRADFLDNCTGNLCARLLRPAPFRRHHGQHRPHRPVTEGEPS
ncbi:hypothetical protein SGL43_04658 [Streptomyces globisporus]|uniref:Uncharacterized protein n=1 Tax=Streptomyces globisporus TaxID=1908 RepID=A0ABN8V778_STRGL|nr:hypothetical protein SGL43_04658 [Streptomyces globisporus]